MSCRNQEETIEHAKEYVKGILSQDYSGHDYWHVLRVWDIAKKLATEEGADVFVVELVALLHDVDDKKLSPATYQNKDNARKFLRSENIAEELSEKICSYIDQISFSSNKTMSPKDKEVMCVQDADRLDAIGAIGIARAFAFGGNKNRPMYIPNCNTEIQENNSSLQHFYDKLFLLKDLMNTDSAKRIAEKRDLFMRQFASEFLEEWNGLC